MKIAIMGTGRIARNMAAFTIARMDSAEAYAVGSRSLPRAQEFAALYGFGKAYGSYEEMVQDPEIDLVYIATPHSEHFKNAKLCLKNGKNILMEKVFTLNAAEAEELIALSEKTGCLLAEALWTRYMPSRKILSDLLDRGVIGRVTSLSANLGYPLTHKERVTDPALGGGALLDVGVYPINFALMAIHEEVTRVQSCAVMSPEGVDWVNSVTLTFESGIMAMLHSSMLAHLDRNGYIYGDQGFLQAVNINNCEEILQYDHQYQVVARYEIPGQLSGYEHEIQACFDAIAASQIECPQMPHSETLRVMRLLDQIRAQW